MRAFKTGYEEFEMQGGRKAWTGAIEYDKGFVTIVWNDACDQQVFHALASLEFEDEKQKVIRTVPCSDGDCTWVATLKSEARDEFNDEEIPIPEYSRSLSRRDNPSSMSTIRVLWVLSKPSENKWGRQTLMSMVTGGVASANRAYANSNVGIHIELAKIISTNWDRDSAGYEVALRDLDNGRVQGAAAARNAYRADLVQMVINNSQYCGLGNMMTSPSHSFAQYAHSIVYGGCFSQYSHIHEMSHNMGCQHDRDHGGGSHWSYGYGWKYCDGPKYRTIMSYSCDGSMRVPYFSSPSVHYKNYPTGNSGADNARVLRETKDVVSNFF
jgi:hypothetical protein